MTLALYRKHRPQFFSEIIGQEHVVKTLTNAISLGMISHAYLFSGPRGSGKTTIARLFAKALNCENKGNDFEPCNKCSSCVEITQGRAIDLVEIDAASHRGVDEIRELREGIRFVPTKSKYRIFIIDESHQLTREAANALLKTLEEPPGHAIFILATTEFHKMIPTILSRCQRFDFRMLTLNEIIKRLEIVAKKEDVKIEKEALRLIAINSGGSLRDAESLLDQLITFAGQNKMIKKEEIKDLLGIVDIVLVKELLDLIIKKQAAPALQFLQEKLEQGIDIQEFTKQFINYLRQGMVLKINPELNNPIISGLTPEEMDALKNQTTGIEEKEIHKMLNLFLDAGNRIKYSPIPQLPVELAIIDSIGVDDQ